MSTTLRTKLTKVIEAIEVARTKLIELDLQKAALEKELASFIDTNAIVFGTVVIFVFGRGEKRRELQGTVVGRKEGDEKRVAKLKIGVGDGFDAELFEISVKDVVTIVGAHQF
mgnify:FL=1